MATNANFFEMLCATVQENGNLDAGGNRSYPDNIVLHSSGRLQPSYARTHDHCHHLN